MLSPAQGLCARAVLPHCPSGVSRGTRRRTPSPQPEGETMRGRGSGFRFPFWRSPPHHPSSAPPLPPLHKLRPPGTPPPFWGRHSRGRGRWRMMGPTLACVCLTLLLGFSLLFLSWRQALLLGDPDTGFDSTGVSQADLAAAEAELTARLGQRPELVGSVWASGAGPARRLRGQAQGEGPGGGSGSEESEDASEDLWGDWEEDSEPGQGRAGSGTGAGAGARAGAGAGAERGFLWGADSADSAGALQRDPFFSPGERGLLNSREQEGEREGVDQRKSAGPFFHTAPAGVCACASGGAGADGNAACGKPDVLLVAKGTMTSRLETLGLAALLAGTQTPWLFPILASPAPGEPAPGSDRSSDSYSDTHNSNTGHGSDNGHTGESSGMDSDAPLGLLRAALKRFQSARTRHGAALHVRVLWALSPEDAVGEWEDYFQPLCLADSSGAVILEVHQQHPQHDQQQQQQQQGQNMGGQQQQEQEDAVLEYTRGMQHFQVPLSLAAASKSGSWEAQRLPKAPRAPLLSDPFRRWDWPETGSGGAALGGVATGAMGYYLPSVGWAVDFWTALAQYLAPSNTKGSTDNTAIKGTKGTRGSTGSGTPTSDQAQRRAQRRARLSLQRRLGEASDACLALLAPGAPVEAILGGESQQDRARLADSVAVYLEHAAPQWWPGPPSQGTGSHPPPCLPHALFNCTVYHMATMMLQSRATQFAVASFWPSWAATLRDAFHASSAPLVLRATAAGGRDCAAWDPPVPALGPSVAERERARTGELRKAHLRGKLLSRRRPLTLPTPLAQGPSRNGDAASSSLPTRHLLSAREPSVGLRTPSQEEHDRGQNKAQNKNQTEGQGKGGFVSASFSARNLLTVPEPPGEPPSAGLWPSWTRAVFRTHSPGKRLAFRRRGAGGEGLGGAVGGAAGTGQVEGANGVAAAARGASAEAQERAAAAAAAGGFDPRVAAAAADAAAEAASGARPRLEGPTRAGRQGADGTPLGHYDGQVKRCSQLWVAELFLLSSARGLLRSDPRSLESRFILAHMRHRAAHHEATSLRGQSQSQSQTQSQAESQSEPESQPPTQSQLRSDLESHELLHQHQSLQPQPQWQPQQQRQQQAHASKKSALDLQLPLHAGSSAVGGPEGLPAQALPESSKAMTPSQGTAEENPGWGGRGADVARALCRREAYFGALMDSQAASEIDLSPYVHARALGGVDRSTNHVGQQKGQIKGQENGQQEGKHNAQVPQEPGEARALRGGSNEAGRARVYHGGSGAQQVPRGSPGVAQRRAAQNFLAPGCGPSGSCGVIGSLGLPAITGSFWAHHVYVDDTLGVLYCSIHKVASTKIMQWLRYAKARQRKGLPWEAPPVGSTPGWHGPRNASWHHNVTDAAGEDLAGLRYSFDEGEAIRQVTRRDLYRVAFARSPFSRVASAYLDKHVRGGDQKSRAYWNKLFFPYCAQQLNRLMAAKAEAANASASHGAEAEFLGEGEPPVLSLDEFVELLHCAHRHHDTPLENHINPQANMCNLQGIQFDLLGRLETFSRDIETLLSHLRLPPGALAAARDFFAVPSPHSTYAARRLASLFTSQRSREVVEDVYRCDMSLPLNGIEWSPLQPADS